MHQGIIRAYFWPHLGNSQVISQDLKSIASLRVWQSSLLPLDGLGCLPYAAIRKGHAIAQVHSTQHFNIILFGEEEAEHALCCRKWGVIHSLRIWRHILTWKNDQLDDTTMCSRGVVSLHKIPTTWPNPSITRLSSIPQMQGVSALPVCLCQWKCQSHTVLQNQFSPWTPPCFDHDNIRTLNSAHFPWW